MKHPSPFTLDGMLFFLKDSMERYLDSIGATVIYDTVHRCIHAKLFTPPEKENCTSRKLSRKTLTQHETSLDRFIA